MEELAEGGYSLLSQTKVTDGAPQNKVLEFDKDTEKMAISPPTQGYQRGTGDPAQNKIKTVPWLSSSRRKRRIFHRHRLPTPT